MAPRAQSAPTITGDAVEGQTLVEGHAAWLGSPTGFVYQWERCDGYGRTCAAIPGATAQTYAVTGADVVHTLRVGESASDASGTSGPAVSAPTAIVLSPSAQGQPPENAAAPVIFGTAYVGGALQASTGAWASATRLSYGYQWQRCRAGCLNIRGATRPQYVPVDADLGAGIRVLVSAKNQAGRSSAPSARTGPVGETSRLVRQPLVAALVPRRRSAGLRMIRASDGYTTVFSAPLRGHLTLVWWYLPKGAHLSRDSAHPQPSPVPVAVGGANITRRGRTRVRIRLTIGGRELLQGATRIKLTGEATFAIGGRPQVRVVESFSLER